MANNKNFQKIIHQISYSPKKRINLFQSLTPELKRDVILKLSKHLQYEIISRLSQKEALDVLERLDSDEATDILQLLPARKRKNLINKINKQLRSEISLLLKFDPESAAGLMSLDYILVEKEDNIASVAKQVKIHERRTGKLPTILVMDQGKLAGYLPGHELGFAQPHEKAKKYTKKIKTVKYSINYREIINLFRQNPHNKIVVLGDKKNVLGIIYSDDVIKILQDKESSSLYNFAGVHKEESVYDSIRRKINFRYKWLVVNLGTAFLAASVVGIFNKTISKYVLLAVYMPIVAGMGGNAATQTLAVMVRGLALNQINFKTVWHTLKNELGAGLINGLINGIIVASVVLVVNHNLKIGLILSLAMVINLLIAAFFGTITPLIMKSLGKDPASSATIFITTATDVFGFLAFLGLATLILN